MSDLQRLSTVVTQIDTALGQLDVVPPPEPTRLVMSPVLLALGGNHNWDATRTGAVQAFPGRQPIGGVNVTFPDGVRLISLRGAGLSDGLSLFSIGLTRVPYDAPEPFATLSTPRPTCSTSRPR